MRIVAKMAKNTRIPLDKNLLERIGRMSYIARYLARRTPVGVVDRRQSRGAVLVAVAGMPSLWTFSVVDLH